MICWPFNPAVCGYYLGGGHGMSMTVHCMENKLWNDELPEYYRLTGGPVGALATDKRVKEADKWYTETDINRKEL